MCVMISSGSPQHIRHYYLSMMCMIVSSGPPNTSLLSGYPGLSESVAEKLCDATNSEMQDITSLLSRYPGLSESVVEKLCGATISEMQDITSLLS